MLRRDFMLDTGAAAAAAAIAMTRASAATAAPRRLRVANVGTGSRGTGMWGKPLVDDYSDVVDLVGLCDHNGLRVKAAQSLIGTKVPTYTDFDCMVKETRPDTVIVTTVDSIHARYIIRALELGCDVISEKPLCTDENQVREILDAQKRTGRNVTVAFNARHAPKAKRLKQLLMEKAIGNVFSVDFQEHLNTSHGADYFRRWHSLKENSGTLLVHKATHHFDLVNWWLDARPVEVSAWGELRFYGRNNSRRGKNCRTCSFKDTCKFYWDVIKNEEAVKLYVNCEKEDGYLRDACVFRESTNIYDAMSARVKYDNGVLLTYTANTYSPYEGSVVTFNGSEGRIDMKGLFGAGFVANELRMARQFGKSELVQNIEKARPGGHGGNDPNVQDLLFRNLPAADPLGLRADLRAGALSALIGIAAYRSIERGGALVKINDLGKV